MILPGSARLNVKLLPPVGLKIAEGLDVSGPKLKSSSTFRFLSGTSVGNPSLTDASSCVLLTCDWAYFG